MALNSTPIFFVVFFFYPTTKNIVLEDMQKKLASA
jgi:hypothetical protein